MVGLKSGTGGAQAEYDKEENGSDNKGLKSEIEGEGHYILTLGGANCFITNPIDLRKCV